MKQFPKASSGFSLGGAAAPAAAAADDDDDVDLFGSRYIFVSTCNSSILCVLSICPVDCWYIDMLQRRGGVRGEEEDHRGEAEGLP